FLHVFNGYFCISSLGFQVSVDVEVSRGVHAFCPAVQLEVGPGSQTGFGKSFSNRFSSPFTASFGGVQGVSLGSQVVVGVEVCVRAGQLFCAELVEVFFRGQTSQCDSFFNLLGGPLTVGFCVQLDELGELASQVIFFNE